jgi:polysaccharide biosynthesis protein PslG
MSVQLMTFGWPAVSLGTLGKPVGSSWATVEHSPGSYTWTGVDNAVQAALSHGLTSIIYTIYGVPTFYASDTSSCGQLGCPGPPNDLGAFTSFVTALATRYKGEITYYELWNEGNRPQNWTGTAAQFVMLGQAAYNAIKAVDPNAKVLTPSPDAGSSFASFVQGYLQAGGTTYADGVSFHGYRCQDGVPSAGVTCLQGTSCDNNALDCAGEPLEQQIANIRSAAAAGNASSKPIYDTEGGWGQNSELPNAADQAAYVSRWYIIQAGEGIPIATWYGWGVGQPSNPSAWGSYAGVSQVTTAYQTTYNWLNGATLTSACAFDSNNIWTCPIKFSNGNSGLLVWDGNSHFIDGITTTYTPASQYLQYESFSSTSPVSIPAGGTVTIGEAPILLETGNRP